MDNYKGWIKEEYALSILERIQDKNAIERKELEKKYLKLIAFIILSFTVPISIFICWWSYWYYHTPPTHNYVNNSTVDGSFNNPKEVCK